MTKKNTFFFISAAFLGLLSSCGGQAPASTASSEAVTSEEISSEPACEAITDEATINQLKVEGGDAIYGNIYLPSEIDGAAVTWKSSDPSVISDQKNGQKEAGVVHRGSEDKQVTLTATMAGEEKCRAYTQTVTVKALKKEIKDEDYVGYLFGHFISEDGQNNNGQSVAVGEQMYFAFADVGKGLHFKDLSTKNNPILSSTVGECGVRDPFMMRSPEGDRFFIVATDLSVYTRGGWGQNTNDKFSRTGSHSLVFWESMDLVNWTESRLIHVAPSNAGMAWAPEMIYHEETAQYVIFFASCLVNEDRSEKIQKDAIYCVATRDFVHFSEPKLMINNMPDESLNLGRRSVIDASLLRVGDTYYSAVKDGDNYDANGGILIQKTKDIFNYESWTKVLDLDETGLLVGGSKAPSNRNLEGPEWFIYNRADRQDPDVPEYGLMGDQYMNSGAGYLPFATASIENGPWRMLEAGTDKDYSWDSLTKRHGTIMRLTSEECARIRDHYKL